MAFYKPEGEKVDYPRALVPGLAILNYEFDALFGSSRLRVLNLLFTLGEFVSEVGIHVGSILLGLAIADRFDSLSAGVIAAGASYLLGRFFIAGETLIFEKLRYKELFG